MSGHVHPDELTELERHNSVLDCYSYCQYCAADEHSRNREEVIQELVTALEHCVTELERGGSSTKLTEYRLLAQRHKRAPNDRG